MLTRRCCIICTRKATKRRDCFYRIATRRIRPATAAMFDDTIAAIATPLGEGGLAVVRISGAQAFAVADKVFLPVGKSSQKPSAATSHTIHFGKIVRGEQVIDEVLLAVLRAPRTFTREDTVEISCH